MEKRKRLTIRRTLPQYLSQKNTNRRNDPFARVLGLEKELGTIEEGKIADLIMVSGNPLEHIVILLDRKSICLVMQGGKFARNDLP